MKELKDILKSIDIQDLKGPANPRISSICFDSREATDGSLFIAVKGTQADGHDFIPVVLKKGSIAVVCEEYPAHLPDHISFIKVKDSKEALGFLASAWFGHPSKSLFLIGVTGTNGKTTIVTLLHDLFSKLGYQVGMLSTIQNRMNGQIVAATHTTPDPIQINRLLHRMTESGCSHCFMEVSSHAIHQRRIKGLDFNGGIFTNITHDHLDYHGDFAEYLKSKKKFFDDLPEKAFALVNKDDKNGRVMLQNTKASKSAYSLSAPADFNGRIIENQFEGLMMKINGQEAWFRLVGKFNAYNILAVYAAAMLSGEAKEEVLSALSSLPGAEGRFELLRSENNITAIVDYAHTPDALKNVLSTINGTRTKNEELITVVGAGGDRDPSKRPVMGRIAASMSTKVIFTSDNPRTEDPDMIIEDMIKGVEGTDYKKILSISSRKEAIKTACMLARPGDIILVAGKGHEKYQEIKGVKQHFDDKEVIGEFLTAKGKEK